MLLRFFLYLLSLGLLSSLSSSRAFSIPGAISHCSKQFFINKTPQRCPFSFVPSTLLQSSVINTVGLPCIAQDDGSSVVTDDGFSKPNSGAVSFLGNVQDLTNAVPTPSSDVSSSERYPFQAEVKRVLDIIVHSLYTDKDVFLRELVSNAADACDKKRLRLTGKGKDSSSVLKAYRSSIRVYANKDEGTLTIEDNGIGMSKEELIENLGTIAKSGTFKFAQQLEETGGGTSDLIGHFGVGFYSAFLVAKRVDVISTSFPETDDPKPTVWRWSSSCGQSFSLEEVDSVSEISRWTEQQRKILADTKAQILAEVPAMSEDAIALETQRSENDLQTDVNIFSGTRVVLHLKEECDDYLEDYRMKELLRKYSEFLNTPIYLLSERIEYERVLDSSSPEESSSAARYKTVTKKYHEWIHLNKQPPIWTRHESQLKEKDYVDFYKTTFKAFDDPLSFLHMSVDGQVSFRALLFVPGSLPWELSRNMFDEESRGIRLYVKRVFINDKFQEAVPRWLTFIRGIVDSDDLPLNVGREILQKSKMLRIIHSRIADKAIHMMKALKKQGGEKWQRFWENYGKYLKIGAVEDRDHQEDIASLVHFHSTHSSTELTTLDEYIDRFEIRNKALENESAQNSSARQNAIYYLAAENRKAAQDSPALELLRSKGFEVLFGVDPLDEFFLASLSVNQYKGYPVLDANKSDLKLTGNAIQVDAKLSDPSAASEPFAAQPKSIEPSALDTRKIELGGLVEWIQQTLGPRVHDVVISDRLVFHPAVLVQGDFGLSPTMQRYIKQQAAAQGVAEQELYGANLSQPIFEINPMHPIVEQLDLMVRSDPTSVDARDLVLQLFDVAALQGGYTLEHTGAFAKKVIAMMSREAHEFTKLKKVA